MGDFNAHDQYLNCSTNRPKGNQLLKFANRIYLNTIAHTNPSTFGYNSTSIIDFLPIKNFLVPIYISSLSELNSDQNPVEVSFKYNYILPPEIVTLILIGHFLLIFSSFTNH
ncbi:hypothetical protein CDAR_424891 [Caerostris darwini]|uniref:Endonuclease/exonuclease/phosphatase domain-containing protein n=1 Tax=Caerostris darwini TaxID=1538125 RepID=A0AAV4W7G3_9ARAC|nr:hypothetical protein CDAR_424891 [Caerostris darwini]